MNRKTENEYLSSTKILWKYQTHAHKFVDPSYNQNGQIFLFTWNGTGLHLPSQNNFPCQKHGALWVKSIMTPTMKQTACIRQTGSQPAFAISQLYLNYNANFQSLLQSLYHCAPHRIHKFKILLHHSFLSQSANREMMLNKYLHKAMKAAPLAELL